jgi:NO-binding membrane sensor protein with MHYT domain/nitrogen-specific signal transduction histidine kinase/CheY-like chemotaxis protein
MLLDGWYNPQLVFLSILIASLASYTALDLAARLTVAQGRERLAWLAGGSLAMGIGIWSMHFVGMLAFHLPRPMAYGVQLVLLSVLVAIVASAFALTVVSRRSVSLVGLAISALWMGPAIAGMHYIGMAALQVEARMQFDPILVTASVAIAVAASFVGLWLAYRYRSDESRRTRLRRLASGAIMGGAIAGMHYTGMAAATFTANGHSGHDTGGLLATGGLTIGVVLGTLTILGLGLLGAMLDRWLRSRAAEAERRRESQKLEAIGQLAGGVAHDFNNLLTAIMGHVEFVLEALPAGSPVHEDVLQIRHAAERAAELTRQLLAFSRRQMLRPVQLDLNQVVTGTMRMLQRVLDARINVRLGLEPNLGVTRADVSQLEQVIVNLVVNARDAMPEGGTLTVETANVDLEAGPTGQHLGTLPGSYVMLAFTDTGAGMTPEVQARIFDPFFTTKGQGRGTGLGLSTVYGIIKQSGGSISVYSEPGRGSTFKVYLPRAAEAEPEMATAMPGQAPAGTETILLVEDDEAVRELARRSLRARGYTVLSARDGAEALRMAEEHTGPLDLLLTDVVLPNLTGPELAERLRQRRGALRVLFMSGFPGSAVIANGTLTETAAFLPKAFTPDSLVRKVQEVLQSVVPEV